MLGDSGRRHTNKNVMWLCRCDCGNITTVRTYSLKCGDTKSCGCICANRTWITNFKHGGRHTRLYKTWQDMKSRCHNPNDHAYKYYGGKNIQICSNWEHDFVVFRDWSLANGYADNLTIDRINNKGNYEPSNCQWLTKSENARKAMQFRWSS